MSMMRREIELCLRASLEMMLDAFLASRGFARRKNSLIYSRTLPEAHQQIRIHVEIHPKDRPDAAAVVYPFLRVSMDSVNALVKEMSGHDDAMVAASGITLNQPIAFTSGNKGLGARWPVFQPDSVPGVVSELKSFLEQWTVPFLDLYSTPAGICEAYDRGDSQTIGTLPEKLRVTAAMVLCGRTADALDVMERWFGRPGPRKRYQRVFDYLAAEE